MISFSKSGDAGIPSGMSSIKRKTVRMGDTMIQKRKADMQDINESVMFT